MCKYVVFILIVLSIACSRQDSDIRKIEFDFTKDIAKGELVVDSVIYLETIDESLLSEVSILKYNEGRFFILDKHMGKSLFVFNFKGKFLKKTVKGKGPGECLTPLDFLIDNENNEVLVWDQMSQRMNYYDLGFNFIRSKQYPDLTIRNFKRINDDYLVYYQDRQGDIEYDYLVYNSDFTEIKTKILMDRPELTTLSLPSVISNGDYTRYLKVFDNRIYGIKDGKEFIDYKLDFKQLNITKNDIDEGIDHVFSLAYAGKRVVSIHHLIYNENYLAFSFFYSGALHSCVYSLNSRSIYYFGPYIDKALSDFQIKSYIPQTKTFIAVADATEADVFENKTSGNSIINKKYSNPAIVFFKIKE